ncbi:universal stress protein [Methanolobus halotolerans]|uniref:Universal stress protein n=1 Tax=Methanolobus halotolerans TaxID=2052935 RepID=A0A4E0PZ81_9EURY|nr:universal stress protein [Methanolobus halotolerans]TGC10953.1 universal stress protein [Methanolobus halotolerans]
MKILIPTDGSAYAENAARVAARIAMEHDYHLILLHVVDDKGFTRKTWRKEGAENILQGLRDVLLQMGCEEGRIETTVVGGNAPEMIVEVAKQFNVDRIVMGTQGKNGIKKLVGTVTEKVLQMSDVLVLVVPPGYNSSQDSS